MLYNNYITCDFWAYYAVLPHSKYQQENISRRTEMGNFFRRILAFILGIVFCVTASVGGIVGGAYWAYKNLTLSKVGVNDPSLGDLTDQPIEDLVDLIINGAKDPSSYTFAELEKKYGLKLDDVLSKLGLKVEIVTKDQELNFNALKDISIFTLFDKSGDGINLLLDSLSARALFNFFPDSFLSAGTRAQLSVYSVADLVNKEETTGKLGLYSALNSAKVGGILPTVFEEKYNQSTHTYEYEVKEDKNQALSLVKDMEVGAFIKTFIDGDSDILTELNSGGLSSIGDMQISEVFSTIAGAFSESAKEAVEKYGQILAGKTVRDLFVLTENGKYSFAIENLFNDIKLGYIFGYKEVDGVWYDGDKVANGVLAVLSDVNLYNIVKGISESKVKDAIISELGIINLGDIFEQFLGYRQENGQWVDANGKAMPKILQGLAGVSVAQIFDEDASIVDNIINALDESFGDITAGDVLADFVGFKKIDEQWVDEKGNELNPILSGLLSMRIADLIRKDYTLETIVGIFKEAIGDVKAGEILGYTFDGAKQIWVDSNGNPVNAYINVLCGMDCNNVLDIFLADDSPTNVVRTLLGDINMGDLLVAVLKYSYDEENGKWLTSKGNEAPAGVAKLAEIKLWQFVAAFDKNEPFNLYDMLDGLTLGDFIGVYDEETDTYTITADIIPSLKGKVLSGVLSTLLNIDIGHFLDANTENDEYVQILKDITIGQVVQAITGYAQNSEGDWIAPEGKTTDRLLELLCSIRLSVNDVVELVQGKLTASEFVSKLLGELKVGDFLGSAFGLHYDTATNSFLDKNNEKTYDLYDFLMNINANDVIAFIETKDVLATIKEFISPLQIGDFFAPFTGLKEQDGVWTRENGTQRLIHILESVFNLYLTNVIETVESATKGNLDKLKLVEDLFGRENSVGYFLDFVKLPDNQALTQILDIVIYDLVNDLINEEDKAEVILNYFGDWTIGEAINGVLPERIENNRLTQNIFALSVHSIYTDIIKSSDVLTALEEKIFDGVSLSTIVSYALEDQSKLPTIVKDLLALEINYIIDNVKTAVDTGNVYIGNIVKTICGERTIKDYLQDFVKLPDNEVLNQVTSVVISDFVTDLGKDDKAEVILEYFGEWTIGQALKGLLPKAIEDNQLTQNVFALSLYAIYTQIVKADDVLAAVEEKVFDGVTLSTLVSYAVNDQSKFPNIAKDLLALEVNYIIDTVKTAVKDQTIYLGNIINKICKGRTIADYVEDFVKLPDNEALNQIKSVVICDFYNDLIASSDKAQVILDYFGSWTLGEALGKGNKQEGEITTQNAYDASVLNSGAATQALVNGTTVEAGNKFTENMYALSAVSVYTDIIKADDVLAAIEEKVFDGVNLSMIAAYAIANQSGLPNIVKDILAVEVNYIIDTVKTSIDTGVVYVVDIVSKVCGDRTIGDYLDFVKLPDNEAVNNITSVVIRDFVKDLFATSDKTDAVLDAFGTWTVGDAVDGVLPARLKENQFIKNVTGISAKTFYTDILKSSDVLDSVKTKILNEVKFSTIVDFVMADQSKLPKIAKDLLNVELNYVADTVKQISADGIVYVTDIVKNICGDSTIGDYVKDFVKLPDNDAVNKVTSVVISAFVKDVIDESDKVQVILDYFGTWTIGEVLNGVLPENIEENRLTQNLFALSAMTIYTDIIKASDILAAVQDKVLDGVKFSTLLAYAMQDQTKLPTIAHDLLGVEINYIINIIKSGKIDVADTVAYVCGVHTINDYLKDFVTLPDIDALNKITSIVISEFVNDIFNQNDKVQVLLDYFGVVRFGEILGGLTGYEEDEEFGVWVRKDDKNLKAYTLLEIAYDLEIKDVLGFALGGKFGTNDIATFIQESVQGNETIGSLLYDLIGMTNEEGVYYFSNGQRAFRAIQEVFGINVVELIKDAQTYLQNYASYELDDIIQMIGELEGYKYDYSADKFTETPVFAYVTIGVAGVALYFLANDVLVDLAGDMTYFDALKDALNVTENEGKYVFASTSVDTPLYNKLMPKKMGETLKKGYDFLGEFKDVLGVGNLAAPFTDKLGKYTVSYTTEESGEITWKVVGDFGSVISGLYNVTYTGLEKAIKDKTIVDYVIGLFKEVSLGDVSEKFLPEKIKTNKLVANVLDVTLGIIYYDLVKGSDRLATIQQYILDGVSTSTLLDFVMTKESQDKLPRLVRDLIAVEFNYIIDEVKTVIDTKKLYLLDIISNIVGETTTIKDYLDFVKLPNNDAVNKVTAVVIYEFAEAMLNSDDKTTVILDYFGTFTIGDVLNGALPKNIEDNQLTQNVYALSALIIYEDIVKADDKLAAIEEKVLDGVSLSTLLAYAMADQSKLPTIAKDVLAVEINFIIDTTMQIVKDKVVYVSNIVGKLFGERTVGDYLQDFVTIPGNRAIVKLTNIVIYDFVMDVLRSNDKVQVLLNYLGTWTVGDLLETGLPEAIENNQFTQNVYKLSANIIYNDIVKADDVLAAVQEKVFNGVTLSTFVAYAMQDQSKLPNIAKDLLALEVNYIINTVKQIIDTQIVYVADIVKEVCGERTIGDYLDFVKLPDNEVINKVTSVVISEFVADMFRSNDKVQVILNYFGTWTIGDVFYNTFSKEIENNQFTQNVFALSVLSIYTDIVKADDVLAAVEEKVFTNVALSTLLAYAMADQSKLPNIVKDILALEVNFIIDTVKQIVKDKVVYVSNIANELFGERTVGEYLDFVKLPNNDAINNITSVVIYDFVMDLAASKDKVQVVLNYFGTWTIGDLLAGSFNKTIEENQFTQNVYALSANTIYNDIVKADDILAAVEEKVFNGVTLSMLLAYAMADQSKLPNIAKDVLAVEVNYVIDTVKQIIDTQIVYVADIVKEVCGDRTIAEYLDFAKLPDNEAVNKITSVVISAFVADMFRSNDKAQVLLDYFADWRIGDAIGDLAGYIEDEEFNIWITKKDANVKANAIVEVAFDINLKEVLEFVLDGKFKANDIATFVQGVLQGNETVGSLVYDLVGMSETEGVYYFENGQRAYRIIAEAFGINVVELIKDAQTYLKNYASYELDDIIQMIGELEGYKYDYSANKFTKTPVFAYVTVAAIGAVMYFVANDVLVDLVGDMTYFDALKDGLNVTENEGKYVFADTNVDTPLYNKLMPKKIGETLKKGYDFKGEFKDVLGVGNLVAPFTNKLGKYTVSYLTTYSEEGTITWKVEGNYGSVISGLYNVTYNGLEKAIKDKKVGDYVLDLFGEVSVGDLTVQIIPEKVKTNKLVENVNAITVNTVYNEFVKGSDKLAAVQENVLNEVSTSTLLEFAMTKESQDKLPRLVRDLTAVEFNYIIDEVKTVIDTKKLYLLDIISEVMGEETTIRDYLDFVTLPNNDVVNKVTAVVIYDFAEAMINGEDKVGVILDYFGTWTIGDVFYNTFSKEIENNQFTQNVFAVSPNGVYKDIVKADDKLTAVEDVLFTNVTLSTFLAYAMEDQSKLPTIVKDILAVEVNFIIDTVKQIVKDKVVYVSNIVGKLFGERTVGEYLDFVKLPNNNAINNITSVVIYDFVMDLAASKDKVQVLLDYFGTWTIGDLLAGSFNKTIEENQLTQNVFALSANIIYNDIVKADDILAAVEEKVLTNVALSTLLAYAMADQSKLPTIAKDILAVEVNYVIDTAKQIAKDKVVYVSNIVGKIFGERTIGDYAKDFVKLPNNKAINNITSVVIYDFVMDLAASKDKVQVLLNYFGTWTVGDLLEGAFNKTIEENQLTQNVFALSAKVIYNDVVKANDKLTAVKEKVFTNVTLSNVLAYAVKDQSKLPNIAKDILAVEVNYVIDEIKSIIDTKKLYLLDIISDVVGETKTVKDYLDFVKLPDNKAVNKATSVVIYDFADAMIASKDKAQVVLDYFGTWTIGEALGDKLGYAENEELGIWITKKDENVKANTLTETLFDMQIKTPLSFLLKGKFTANDFATLAKEIVNDKETIGLLLYDMFEMKYTDNTYYFKNGQRAYRIVTEVFGLNVIELIKNAKTYIGDYAKYSFGDLVQMIGELEGYKYDYAADKFTKTPVLAYATLGAIGVGMYYGANDLLVKVCGSITYYSALKDVLKITRDGDNYLLGADKLATPLFNKVLPLKLSETLKKGYDLKGLLKDVLSIGNLTAMYTSKLKLGGVAALDSEQNWTVSGKYGNVIAAIYNVNVFEANDAIRKRNGMTLKSYLLDTFDGIVAGDLLAPTLKAELKENVWYKDGKKYLRLYNDLLNTNVVEVIRFTSDAAKSGNFNLRQLLYLMFTDDATVEYYFGQILKYSVNANGDLVNKNGEYANVVIENIFQENFINFIVTTVKNVSKPKTLITDILGNAKIGDIVLTGYRLNASDEWVKADGTVYAFGSSMAAIEKVVYKIEIANLINGFDAGSIFGDMYIGELLGYTKTGDVWYGKDGNVLAGFNLKLANITIEQLTTTTDPLTLFNDMYIGEILGYTKTGDVWYGKDGNALTGFNLKLAQITIEQLTTTDNPIELFGDVYVGEILGYTKNGSVWMRGDTQVTSRFDLVLAEITISQLIAAQNNPLSLFGDVYIGDIIGYTYDEANDKWIDQNNKEIKGFNLAIAKLKVGQINGESDILSLFGDLQIGEMFGYTYENGKWQDKDGKDVNALVNAIASIKISDTTAEGFDLMTTVKDVKLGDVMGYTYNVATNKWTKDGTEAESLIQIIANYTIGGIQDGNFSSTLMNDITSTVTIKDIFKSVYESTDKTGMFALLTDAEWNQPVGNFETIMTNKMSNLVVADLAKLGVISDINKVVNSKIAINGVDGLLKTDAAYGNYRWTDATYDTTGMIETCSKKLIEQGATGEGVYWTEIVKLSDFFDVVFSASL